MFVIITRMDDAPQDGNEVFGPFATKREARVWAKADRAKQCTLVGNEDHSEVFYDSDDEIAFGEFVWAIQKVQRATMPKAKKPAKKRSK